MNDECCKVVAEQTRQVVESVIIDKFDEALEELFELSEKSKKKKRDSSAEVKIKIDVCLSTDGKKVFTAATASVDSKFSTGKVTSVPLVYDPDQPDMFRDAEGKK